MIHKKLSLLLLLFLTTLLTFSSATLFGKDEKKTIFEILTTDKRFTVFLQHIEEAGLTDAFKTIKTGTVFAPDNDAFDHNLIAQRKLKSANLMYHIIPFAAESKDLWDERLLETSARVDDIEQYIKVKKSLTRTITLGPDNGQEFSKVIDSDVKATNGVIHVIDKILSLPVYLGMCI